MIGTVEQWNQSFGFIKAGDGKSYFVNYSDILGAGYRSLHVGDPVTFDVEQTSGGKTRAVRVRLKWDAEPYGEAHLHLPE